MKDYLRTRLDKLNGRMTDGPPPANLVELCLEFSAEVTRALQELLATKHLDHRVKVKLENLNGDSGATAVDSGCHATKKEEPEVSCGKLDLGTVLIKWTAPIRRMRS